MTCFWSGLWLPLITIARLWRSTRRDRITTVDPRWLNAHWRRDLGLDL